VNSITVLRSAADWRAKFRDQSSIVTVGNFDGVHLGHQQILRDVCSVARKNTQIAAVLTFYPHPTRVLRPAQAPPLLMTLEQRLEAIAQLGIEAAFVVPFNAELAAMSAEGFVHQYLADTMHARGVFVGANFRFGHKQGGDVSLLVELGKRWQFEVSIEPPVIQNGVVVSSTVIRKAVAEGKMEEAHALLGRPFALEGEIRTGTGQGRRLVVPTLNLATSQESLPAYGVYATEVTVEGERYKAATNVGLRPTFNGSGVTIESYLIGFSKDLTGGPMEVRFWRRLRGEQKFPNPEVLRQQVLDDIESAKVYFQEEQTRVR